MNKCKNCKYLYDERLCKRINRCCKGIGIDSKMEKTARIRAKVGKHCPLFESVGIFQTLLSKL